MKEIKNNRILMNLLMIFSIIILLLLTFAIVLKITKINTNIDLEEKIKNNGEEEKEVIEEELSIDSKILSMLPTNAIKGLTDRLYYDQKFLAYENLDYATKMKIASIYISDEIGQVVDQNQTILNTGNYVTTENGKAKYISGIYFIQALNKVFGPLSQDLNINKSFDTETMHYEYDNITDGFTIYLKNTQDSLYSIDCVNTKAVKKEDITLYRTCTIYNGNESTSYDIIEVYGVTDNNCYWKSYEVVQQ